MCIGNYIQCAGTKKKGDSLLSTPGHNPRLFYNNSLRALTQARSTKLLSTPTYINEKANESLGTEIFIRSYPLLIIQFRQFFYMLLIQNYSCKKSLKPFILRFAFRIEGKPQSWRGSAQSTERLCVEGRYRASPSQVDTLLPCYRDQNESLGPIML